MRSNEFFGFCKHITQKRENISIDYISFMFRKTNFRSQTTSERMVQGTASRLFKHCECMRHIWTITINSRQGQTSDLYLPSNLCQIQSFMNMSFHISSLLWLHMTEVTAITINQKQLCIPIPMFNIMLEPTFSFLKLIKTANEYNRCFEIHLLCEQ